MRALLVDDDVDLSSLAAMADARRQLASELVAYVGGIDRCVRSLNKFYRRHRLEDN